MQLGRICARTNAARRLAMGSTGALGTLPAAVAFSALSFSLAAGVAMITPAPVTAPATSATAAAGRR